MNLYISNFRRKVMFKHAVQLFIICTAILTLLLTTLYLRAVYDADPLYIFHSPKEVKEKGRLSTNISLPLAKNMRLQAFGIINNYQFDSVILGTSMLENSKSKTFNRELGGTFINLSMAGSSFYERKIILDYLLRTISVKRIIYSLDSYYLDCKEKGHIYNIDNWDFLYAKQQLSILKKFSIYMTKEIMRLILGYDKTRVTTPDSPNSWSTDKKEMIRFGGIDNWIRDQDYSPSTRKFLNIDLPRVTALALKHNEDIPVTDEEHLKKSIEYIENNIFIYVKNNKKIKFYFIFPPYWRLTYATWRQTTPPLFALHQEVVRYVVLQAQLLGNVEIYGFEDCDFVEDIENYKDTVHYHPRINEYITRSIGSGAHRLTPDNVEAYLARCERLARAFDLQAFAADVKERLEFFHN